MTWNTTAPPECVVSVRVVFRRGTHGAEVTTYTTTNTSGTQVIQSPLQCATEYYVRVFVTGDSQRLGSIQRGSNQEQVVVGGKENCVHVRFQLAQLKFLVLPFLHTQCGQAGDDKNI